MLDGERFGIDKFGGVGGSGPWKPRRCCFQGSMQGAEAADLGRGQMVKDHLVASLSPMRFTQVERPVRKSLQSQIR